MTRPGRLFWKLFLAFWLATTLTFLVGMLILGLNNALAGNPQLDALLNNEEQLLQRYGLEPGRQLLEVWQQRPDQAVGLYDSSGQLLAGAAVAAAAYRREITSKDGHSVVLQSTFVPGGPDGPSDDGPPHLTPIIVGTVMSALFSWYLAHYLAWPLAYLRQAMRSVARGRFDTRVKPMMGNRRDEIVDLSEDCDRMARQLRLLVDAQQQLLHDISHELRSPLTRMQAAIGLLHQAPGQPQMLERVQREAERIDILIEELLTLARMQGRPESIESEPLDLIELLASITEDAQFEAGIKGCTVQLEAGPGFVSRCSGELLYRCFENVVRNAVRYTRTASTVMVRAQTQGQSLLVLITDQGEGVDAARLQSMFQPFERGIDDPSCGFGLGLAIAQRAVEMHGGSVRAYNEPFGGLTVEIVLPQRA